MTPDWPEIVREYGPLVWRTACRILANQTDAADCYQETFVAAFEVSRREEIATWPGLLQRIATARSLDQLRRRIREQGRFTSEEAGEHISSDAPDPASNLQASELGARLRSALADLPDRESTVFCLRELNELSFSEIGRELGISENAAGVAAHRARRRLAEMLREFEPNPAKDAVRRVCREVSDE